MFILLGETYNYWVDSLIVGWGTISTSFIELPKVLQKGTVMPVTLDSCKLVMGTERIKPSMICAAGEGVDTCQVILKAEKKILPTFFLILTKFIRVTVEDVF